MTPFTEHTAAKPMKTQLATIEFIGQSPALLDHCGVVLARFPKASTEEAVKILSLYADLIGFKIDWHGSEVSKPE